MEKINVTVDRATLEWLQDQVRRGRFASISHGVRYALQKLRSIEKGEWALIVCETEFERADPENPNYSSTEVDFYAHILYGSEFPQHRLTLRKCLKTGEYEIIRAYAQRFIIEVEVAFKSQSLKEALDFANKEVEKFWGHSLDGKVCQHKPPVLYWNCRIWKETLYDRSIEELENNEYSEVV